MIHTHTHKGHTIEIHHDQDPMNPRKEWDNLGTLAVMGGIGDELPDRDNEPSEKDFVVLPVYRFEHGNIAFSTTPFHCPWDSAQTGYIYAPRGAEGLTDDKIMAVLKAEVETFSQYMNGDVWGYVIPDLDESCWGFFGDPDGYVLEAAQEAIQ
tara:strand:+ start:1304 stop:1762 length:459 start_codon:yes stop_codon:yes gene_type:complete